MRYEEEIVYVPNSFSRELDMRVQRQEMPYGYESQPPAADSGDYDMRKYQSKKEYIFNKR